LSYKLLLTKKELITQSSAARFQFDVQLSAAVPHRWRLRTSKQTNKQTNKISQWRL